MSTEFDTSAWRQFLDDLVAGERHPVKWPRSLLPYHQLPVHLRFMAPGWDGYQASQRLYPGPLRWVNDPVEIDPRAVNLSKKAQGCTNNLYIWVRPDYEWPIRVLTHELAHHTLLHPVHRGRYEYETQTADVKEGERWGEIEAEVTSQLTTWALVHDLDQLEDSRQHLEFELLPPGIRQVSPQHEARILEAAWRILAAGRIRR